LELNLYGAESTLDGFRDTILVEKGFYQPPYGSTDTRFDYLINAQGIREKQTVAYLYIPIMARYRIPVGLDFLHLKGGAKIGIPILGSYSGSIDRITASGWSYAEDQIFDSITPEWGFGTFLGNRLDGKLDLNFSVVLSFEFGYEHVLHSGRGLQFGAYINYGVTNILGSPNTPMVNYNLEAIDPILQPPAAPRTSSFTGRFDSMSTLGFGVTFRFRF
jgi:hypothetical protein